MSWMDKDEYESTLEEVNLHVISVGVLIKEDRNAITISQSYSSDECCMGILTIPKKAILSRKKLCKL